MNTKDIKLTLKKVLAVLSYICLAILFFIAILLAYYIIASQIAKSKGTKPAISLYTIVSPSMEPKIMVNDVIVDYKIQDENSLKIGDIITFYSDVIDTGGYTVTHRIHDIYEKDGVRYYVTKGDNNSDVDAGLITKKNIVGRVKFIIPKIGKLQTILTSKWGWTIIILIPAIAIILVDIKSIIKVYRIKGQIEEIPKIREVDIVIEKEEDKKLRAVVEEANRMNKGK